MKTRSIVLSLMVAISIISGNNVSIITLNAKVIEPVICHTETWTTSYYIDDDKETLYPYIDCKAEVYNDGKVIVSFWNTHEWDGFATVRHKIVLVGTNPYPDDSMPYAFKNHKSYSDENRTYTPFQSIESKITDYSFWDSIDLNYYPNIYKLSETNNPFFYGSNGFKYYYGNKTMATSSILRGYYHSSPLPNLPVETEKRVLTFTPTVDVVKTYKFYLFEHEFEVTPEMLNGSTIAEPQLNDSDKKIQELEGKIKELTEENENLKSRSVFDINDDGAVNVLDLLALKKHLLSF